MFTSMMRGDPVPQEFVMELLGKKIAEKMTECQGFLLDGFPIDMEEAKTFEMKIGEVTR